MLRIAIPIERFEGANSQIAHHFGRAPLFALITLTQDGSIENIKEVQNVEGQRGGHGAAESLAFNLNVDAVVVKGMGPRGLMAFHENKVAVFTGNVNTIAEAIEAYQREELSILIEPCKDAQHKM